MNYSDYIKTYKNSSRQAGGMVNTNEIASHPPELINSNFDNEAFQLYII